MATQIDDIDDTEIDDQQDDKIEQPGDTDTGADGEDELENNDQGEDEDDVISFAGARVADEDEPEGMRNLRTAYRDEKRRREELEARIAPPPTELGPEPTLDDPDVDWDEGLFKAKYAKWTADKAKADQQGNAQREQAEAAQKEWQDDLATYETQKANLKVRDYDAAEDRVVSSLSDTQHALLIQASNNKAALKYALGKNPEKLAELAKITNPVKFTAAVARLDMETTVQKRRPTTQPENAVRGSGGFTKGGDAKMDRLEREAEVSGDRTKIREYRQQLRAQGK